VVIQRVADGPCYGHLDRPDLNVYAALGMNVRVCRSSSRDSPVQSHGWCSRRAEARVAIITPSPAQDFLWPGGAGTYSSTATRGPARGPGTYRTGNLGAGAALQSRQRYRGPPGPGCRRRCLHAGAGRDGRNSEHGTSGRQRRSGNVASAKRFLPELRHSAQVRDGAEGVIGRALSEFRPNGAVLTAQINLDRLLFAWTSPPRERSKFRGSESADALHR
jgi:hypothetical protein